MQAAGHDILNVLKKLNNPADLDEIVNNIAPNHQLSKTKLLRTVKSALEAGAEYGYILKIDDNKYQMKRLNSSSEMNVDVQQAGNASKTSKKTVSKLPSTRKRLNAPLKHRHLYSSSSEEDDLVPNYEYELQDQQEDSCRRARKPRCRRPRRRKSSCRRRRKRRCH